MGQRRGRGGRPKLREADPGEKITISVRITQEMKQRLEEVADASGRSQSQEAELRLVRSLDRQDLLPEVLTLAFGREAAGLLMMLGLVMNVAGEGQHVGSDEELEGKPWTDNPVAFGNVIYAALALLEAAKPKGDDSGPTYGVNIAEAMLKSLRRHHGRHADWFARHSRAVDEIRSILGPIATRMVEARKAAGWVLGLANRLDLMEKKKP